MIIISIECMSYVEKIKVVMYRDDIYSLYVVW